MAVQIQLRRDTAANWTAVDPILAEGEVGLELDTGKAKIGNGVDIWSALSYVAWGAAGLASFEASGGTISSGAASFSNAHGVSFGIAGQTITASINAGALGALAAGSQTATAGTVQFSNSNGISFGMSGSSQITASYTVPSTAGLISAVNLSAGTTSGNITHAIFSDSHNVSFGLNGSTITASASYSQSTAPGAIRAGTQTATSGTVVFSDSNGISFGMSGSSRITASYTVPSTAGLISAVNLSAGTTSSNLTAFTLSNSHNVSFGLDAGTITASASYSQSTAPGALAAGTQTATSGTVVFSNSNGISFGLSGSSRITASYTVPSTAGLISAVNLSAGTTSNNLTAFTLSNANNVSFGLDGSTITASASYSQSTAPSALVAGTQTATSGTVVFSDSNGISFGMSGSSRITASYTVPSTAGLISAVNLSAGTTSNNATAFTFSNSNGVSFGLNGSTITGSVAAGATATGNFGALAGGTQTATSGTVVFSDSNGISFGMSGSSRITASYTVPSTAGLISAVNLSAGTTSNNLTAFTLSNSNNVSFGLNGSTITASASYSQSTSPAALAAGTQTATSGTVVFSDSNGISFGLSGSSCMTASYTVPSTAGLISAVNLSAGTTSNKLAAFTLSNANGVSFGLNGSTVTGSVAAGATATGNFGALAAGTQTATSGTVVFSDSNGISFGLSGSSRITASYTVPSTAGLISAVNLSAGTTSNNLTAFTLSNANGVSFGLNGSTVTGSVAAGATATGNFGAVSFEGPAATTNITSGTLIVKDNPFGFWSYGGGSVAFQPLIVFSAGTTSSGVFRLDFANSNNVTFGISTDGASHATITASIDPGAGGGIAAAAGTQTATSGTVVFANSNNVTFGMSGSTRVTASVNPGVVALSFPGAAANTVYTAGTVTFPDTGFVNWVTGPSGSIAPIPLIGFSAGTTNTSVSAINFLNSNNVSFGVNGNTVTASYAFNLTAPNGSQALSGFAFTNSNNITFGLNAGTITASANIITLSSYEPYPLNLQTLTQTLGLTTATSGVMSLFPFQVVAPVAAEMANVVVSMNFSTSGVAESWSQTGAFQWALYTRPSGTNSTRLSTYASSSLSYGVSFQNSTFTVNQVTTTNAGGVYSTGATSSAGLNLTSQYTGLKLLGLGLGTTLTPGQYWLGMHHRGSFSSVSTRGVLMSLHGMQLTLTGLAPMGSLSSAYSTGTNLPLGLGGNWHLGHASYSVAGMTGITTDITMSQMSQNLTVMPYIRFVSRT